MARHRQEGAFRVRQEEQLRRALRDAGEALEWELLAGDPSARTEEVVSDIRRLTQSGLRQLERDLEAEIEEKRAEIRQLKKTVGVLTKLAQKGEDAFPAEVDYRYTAKQGQSGLVTKTQELVLEAPEEAEKAAANLEQRIDRLGGLRDQMVVHLKQRLKTLEAAKAELRTFVRGTDELVDHVLATLA
ncbi:MAG: hypothetical protein KJO11_08995 [Gemmatimonadetes bacterium]|nr:hypothetical protein [Gemmatimonadota bacterium]MBT8404808.1 hypothetical protein [Gemmatimonadota bacterium]NNK61711.1 hypothetical protein [Gemmatimonadota bacterium]